MHSGLPTRSPFRFQFGPQSRLRHTEEAQRLGLMLALIESPGLAFDVDGPDDLAALLASGDPGYRSLLSNTTGSIWAAAPTGNRGGRHRPTPGC
jgi:2-phospho-L-lactate guanylyltransferase (CobY/MobA/RfbA family)